MTQCRALAFVLMLLVAPKAWPADTPSNMPAPGDAPDMMEQARVAIQQRDWELSLSLLEQAQSSGLDSDDLHNLLGYSLRMKRAPGCPACHTALPARSPTAHREAETAKAHRG